MFRVGLLLIIWSYYSVYAASGICHAFMLTGCCQKRMTHTSCCIHRRVPSDDEQ